MAIESISAQNRMTVTTVSDTSGAGSEWARVPLKSPAGDAGVVELFPQGGKTEPERTTGSAEQVSAMVEDLQASLEMLKQKNTHLNFSVHEETERIVVRITDQDTGDVIREIPSEEFLNLAARLQEMVGLMFDMKI